jgi:hypothetical protein
MQSELMLTSRLPLQIISSRYELGGHMFSGTRVMISS